MTCGRSEVTAVAETENVYGLAVIGAGPAGMAGAVTAAEGGARVVLIDGGRQLGGQFYRHPAEALGARHVERLHHGWEEFARLAERVKALPNIDVLFGHQVWAVEPGFRVHATTGSARSGDAPGDAVRSSGVTVDADAVLLATGSYERVVPFPGWDLPGVFTAGGAQALLKGDLVLPGRRVVVAGTGPLLLAVAAGLSAAGADVAGLFEANRIRGYAKHPRSLLSNPGKLVEGAEYAYRLAAGRVPVRSGHMVAAAEGTDALEAVIVARADGSGGERRIECDALAIGYGLAPQIDIGLTLGCQHQVLADGTVALKVDRSQRTSVAGLYAAGEAAGVAGAQTALVEGEIAGLAVTGAARSRRASALRRRRDRRRAFADVLRKQHPVPPLWRDRLTPETTVCRCEEVPASAITEAVAGLGAADARTVKLLTRAGMGWCQGRMCGFAVACLAKPDAEAPSPQDLLAAARRPLARPVPLGVLADAVSQPVPNEGTEL
jgi:NADPH-dependent 2,4-dienoyl-CoA reductase/sulfur reductase-like enzyme